MQNHDNKPLRKRHQRRRAARLGVALAVTASSLTVAGIATGAGPAQAAGAFNCPTSAALLFLNSSGQLQRRSVAYPGQSTSFSSFQTHTLDSGWNRFGRIFGGADGNVYAIDPVGTDAGLYRARYVDNVISDPERIDTGFTSWGSGEKKARITADASGSIYTLANNGSLYRHTFHPTTGALVRKNIILASGWSNYDLIAAAGDGVIYARTTGGQLYRHLFDPLTDRESGSPKKVGNSGWGTFGQSIFSPGGDVLFGRSASGSLLEYRWDEPSNSWALHQHLVARSDSTPETNWGSSLSAVTDTCWLEGTPASTQPMPDSDWAPVAVSTREAEPGAPDTINFAFTDNAGRVMHTEVDSDIVDAMPDPTVASGEEEFTGQPAIASNPLTGTLEIWAGRRSEGDVHALSPTGQSGAWQRTNRLGKFAGPPAAVTLSNGFNAIFSIDAEGDLWIANPAVTDAGSPSVWRSLGQVAGWRNFGSPSGASLSGQVTTAALGDGKAAVVAQGVDGSIWAATYRAIDSQPTLSAWQSLGGVGFTSRPSVAVLPGGRLQVVARDANGSVVTQKQAADGGFSQQWLSLGGADETVGTPVVVMDPAAALVTVFARSSNSGIMMTREVLQNCDTYQEWVEIAGPDSTGHLFAADPTAFTARTAQGNVWGVASYSGSFGLAVFYKHQTSGSPSPTTCPDGSLQSLQREARAFEVETAPAPRD